MNSSDRQQLIDELCSLNPELKKLDNNELIKVIKLLEKSQPDLPDNQDFKAKLRSELLTKFSQLQNQDPEIKPSLFNLFSLFTMKKIAIFATGLAVVLLPAYFFWSNQEPADKNPQDSNIKLALSSETTEVKNQAFGVIEFGESSPESNPRADAVGLGSQSGGGARTLETSMIARPMPRYNLRYQFTGELELPEAEKLPVYQKSRPQNAASSLSNVITSLDLQVLDLTQLENSEVAELSLVENQEYGYRVFINFTEGQINLSPNHPTWPNPADNCWQQNDTPEQVNECLENLRLTEADLLTDEQLTQISNQFLANYSLQTLDLDEPQVDRRFMERDQELISEEKRFIPSDLTVTYPFTLDNQNIFDFGGQEYGLRVQVDLAEQKVSSLYNLFIPNLERSLYLKETDLEKIEALIASGGILGNQQQGGLEEDLKELVVELNEPEVGYFRHFSYRDGQSQELFIPALIFKTQQEPSGQIYYNETVIVPLIADFKLPQNTPMPLPRSIPAVREDSSTTEEITPQELHAEQNLELEAENQQDLEVQPSE
jgi:hypothetical protein